ncbi:SDR family NAD(P)-dependent oxidoreductase [Streptomyces sp. A1499]|uniref:SDR family NAD(P)-dependent oxidoreductase n=1 Tax=Streptomyces sp. A1499 TaxID=2563104 RepID=UPI00109E8740|nr:SDR family NAD(P)-dependent oxidoreductase [Streptomyces sp. A1499]THC43109.1 SDR family NAD(P)-dependent oxidoreductase [Streptomyces sp. A1499]
MNRILDGRVAVVTGAGRGIGRSHALELARHGAAVVVNDLGGATDGTGNSGQAAQQVADEITAAGGTAVANTDDVADWDGARALIAHAVAAFGRLDILVNNAGILRDSSLVSMTPEAWDAVIHVHLRGTVGPTHHAARHWRAVAKETGSPVDARIVNTSSASGLYGNFGQANYGAAKAGVAAMTVIAAIELAAYGVTVNAVAPVARTRMTEGLLLDTPDIDLRPEHISPLVAWLAGPGGATVTGRVFGAGGGLVGVVEPWRMGPHAQRADIWDAAELAQVMPGLVEKAAPNMDMTGLAPRGGTA